MPDRKLDSAKPQRSDVVMFEARPNSNHFLWGVVVGLYEWGVQIQRKLANDLPRFTVVPPDEVNVVVMRGKRRKQYRRDQS